MNLMAILEKETYRTSTIKMVKYIGADKKRFAELMNIFFTNEYRIAQRAAWVMSYCVRNHPELINPYYKKLLVTLRKPGVHDAITRNIVRQLQDVDIPERYQGEIMDVCFNFITSHDTAVAIKAFSLTVLQNLSKEYPEILPELKLVIEERWEHETAAFRSRAKKILKAKPQL